MKLLNHQKRFEDLQRDLLVSECESSRNRLALEKKDIEVRSFKSSSFSRVSSLRSINYIWCSTKQNKRHRRSCQNTMTMYRNWPNKSGWVFSKTRRMFFSWCSSSIFKKNMNDYKRHRRPIEKISRWMNYWLKLLVFANSIKLSKNEANSMELLSFLFDRCWKTITNVYITKIINSVP